MTRAKFSRLLAVAPILILVGCWPADSGDSAAASVHSEDSLFNRSASETHCISKHMREAIALNEERSVLYASATGGRSKPISESLIKLEKLVLATLPALEGLAVEYQKAGIPIFCLDVVSMSQTEKFVERVAAPVGVFQPFDGLSWTLVLGRALLEADDRKLEEQLERALEILNRNQSFNCMSRHMIESILRSVRLQPVYKRMSLEKGMREPSRLMRVLIHTQISALAVVSHLDEQAATLNAEGIPIICRDVPYIESKLEKILK